MKNIQADLEIQYSFVRIRYIAVLDHRVRYIGYWTIT